MGVVPARVAGVERVVVASPPEAATGEPAPAVLAAAAIAGADEVYAIGGAQAIAALAYGTESVAAVDVIAGPGSPWVQEAKLQCSRRVGIDGYAGPSELVVICDADAPASGSRSTSAPRPSTATTALLVAISHRRRRRSSAIAACDRASSPPTRPSVADAAVELIAVAGRSTPPSRSPRRSRPSTSS